MKAYDLPELGEFLPTSGRWTTVIAMEAMTRYAHAAVTGERERITKLLAAIREHWVKANGEDALSVGALDQIWEVIEDGSFVGVSP